MAQRPVFAPESSNVSRNRVVREEMVEFTWHAGFSPVQKQKSIRSLHEAAKQLGLYPLLEVSTKSANELGIMLSAFNLTLSWGGLPTMPVECAFQGSKEFDDGGPYTDLYRGTARDANRDPRIRESGDLVTFRWSGESWPLTPRTAFYDWLYLNALTQHRKLAKPLLDYNAFSDIEFNPKKSYSTQARSCALFVVLYRLEMLDTALQSKEAFLSVLHETESTNQYTQASLDLDPPNRDLWT